MAATATARRYLPVLRSVARLLIRGRHLPLASLSIQAFDGDPDHRVHVSGCLDDEHQVAAWAAALPDATVTSYPYFDGISATVHHKVSTLAFDGISVQLIAIVPAERPASLHATVVPA